MGIHLQVFITSICIELMYQISLHGIDADGFAREAAYRRQRLRSADMERRKAHERFQAGFGLSADRGSAAGNRQACGGYRRRQAQPDVDGRDRIGKDLYQQRIMYYGAPTNENCALHQRFIAKQIKRARAIALMPYSR